MILLAKIALGMAGAAVAGAGVLCSEGLVQVKVIEKQPQGVHIRMFAPAMLAPMAMHLAPRQSLAEATREIHPYLPVIRATMESLRQADDVVFVQVEGPGEHVKVQKLGGSIIVDVDDPDATVHVTAPIRAIASTMEQLAAADSNSL